jgi:phage-related protein
MATLLGNAYVRIRPDMDGFERDANRSIGAAMRSAAKVAAVAAGTAVAAAGVLFVKDSITAASDLNESINAVNVSFGKSAKGILALGENAAKSVGLSKNEFNGLAVQFGNFAKTVAGPGGDVVATMKDLTGRSADFASVMNLDVKDAANIFQSGLAGESEPLRKYGIDLSDAAVKAHALAKGIWDGNGEMTEAEKVQARYSLLMKETSKTAGDFANTSDGLANRQRILKADMENAKAEIGTALIPVMQKLVGVVQERVVPALKKFGEWINGDGQRVIGNLGRWLKDNQGWLIKVAAAVTGVYLAWKAYQGVMAVVDLVRTAIEIGKQTAAWIANTASMVANKSAWIASQAVAVGSFIWTVATTVGGATAAWIANTGAVVANKIAQAASVVVVGVVTGATALWTAAQWALNVALNANPIGIIILAVAGLVAGIVLLWQKNEGFRNAVIAVWDAIKNGIGVVVDWLKEWVPAAWEWVKEKVGVAVEAIWTAVKWYWDLLSGYISFWVDVVKTVVTTAWDVIKTATQVAWDAIKTFIIDPIAAAWAKVGDIIGTVRDWLSETWGTIRDRASEAWHNVKSAIVGPISTLWEKLVEFLGPEGTLRTGLSNAWEKIQDKASTAWTGVKNAITSPISELWGFFKDILGVNDKGEIGETGALGRLVGAFGAVSTAVENALGGLKKAVAKPVAEAFTWVNDNIITKINDNILATFDHGDTKIRIPLLPIPKYATGGMISGPGTGTSDSVLLAASNGEFIVNAAQTAKHRGLLESINSGRGTGAAAAQTPGARTVTATNSQPEKAPSAGSIIDKLFKRGAAAAIRMIGNPALDTMRRMVGGSVGGEFAVSSFGSVLNGVQKWADAQEIAPTPLMEAIASYMESIIGDVGYYHQCLRTINLLLQRLGQRFGFVVNDVATSGTAWEAGQKVISRGLLHQGLNGPRGALGFWDPGVGNYAGHIAALDGRGNFINNFGHDNIERLPLDPTGLGGYRGWAYPWALIAGGKQYDSGGWLEPGWTATYNGTGKPEAILTAEQWKTLTAGGRQTTNHFHIHEASPVTEDGIIAAQQHLEALYAGVI